MSITPRGEYDPAETYDRLDAVRYEGSGYLALRNGLTGAAPEDGEDWMLMAERGDPGPRGEPGDPGDPGPQGEPGRDFRILGYYDTLEELEAAAPAPEIGDNYGVGTKAPYDIYTYSETEGGPDWVNNGTIQGPPGQGGDTWVPSVDESGELTWTKNSGTEPSAVNIRGPKGKDGDPGTPGKDGDPGADGKSAYQAAREGGYGGGEEQFNSDLAAVSGKQDKLIGAKGQVVGFDEDGSAVAQEAPSGGSASAVTVTLTRAGWQQGSDGRLSQTVSVKGMTANTPVVLLDAALIGTDQDSDSIVLSAWGLPSAHGVTQGNGTLTFYSWFTPDVDIPVRVGVIG